MGGKALKTTKTERVTTTKLNYIYNTIIQPVLYEFGIDSCVPQHYHLKETHGDLDVVLKMENDHSKVMEIIQRFADDGVRETSEVNAPKGCNCYSFEIYNFQVDFLVNGVENYETSYHFFSHGDLHNLLGKMYHQFSGLKMGYDGLKYPYYHNNQRVGNIYLTKDYRKIYEFLGLDYDQIQEGFDTIEDMFEFVIGCKYFTTKSYLDENMRGKDKQRNKKRQGFLEFREFMKTLDESYDREFQNVSLETLKDFFDKELWDLQEFAINNKIERDERIKEKFNGGLVSELTGIPKGKDLGMFIVGLKEFVCSKDINNIFESFEDFVYYTSSDTIKLFIRQYQDVLK